MKKVIRSLKIRKCFFFSKLYHISLQTVVNQWLMYEGHSIGIGDTIADSQTYLDIQSQIKGAKEEVIKVRK